MTDLQPTRRNVVRSAAWTLPVVAASTAAPAFAASPCATSYSWRLDWGGPTTTWSQSTTNGVQTGTAVVSGSAGTAPVTATFRSVMVGSMQRDPDNMLISSGLTQTAAVTNVGGLNQGPGLNISHASPLPSGRGNRQDISISFNRAVSGLAFVITDIDISTGAWSDRVELTGTRTGVGANILGSGTSTDPWLANAAGNAGNASNLRNLAVTYSGSLAANTAVVLSFWNESGNGNQRIFLSDLTFDALGC